MGGCGSWGLAYTYPYLFPAAVPVYGGGEPEKVHLMKEIQTWVFYGTKDTAVPLQRSQEMVDALEAAGGDFRFTVYPEAGHVGGMRKCIRRSRVVGVVGNTAAGRITMLNTWVYWLAKDVKGIIALSSKSKYAFKKAT